MPVRKRGDVWYYDFQIKGSRYRGSIPEARLKSEAEQDEVEKRKEVFEGRYGRPQGSRPFAEFVGDPEAEGDNFAEGTYLDWARTNKKTWRHDRFRAKVLVEAFRGKTLREVSPLLIEKFKRDRCKSTTKRNTERSPATVNRELELLSEIFGLAMKYREIDTNPCREVEHFKEDNEQYRYRTRLTRVSRRPWSTRRRWRTDTAGLSKGLCGRCAIYAAMRPPSRSTTRSRSTLPPTAASRSTCLKIA